MALRRSRKKTIDARKGGLSDPGPQLSLFDLEPAPADSQPQETGELSPVDLKRANEYGQPTQMPLPVGVGIPEGEDGASERAEVANSPTDTKEERDDAEAGPEAFLKLVARIALRAGQKDTKQEGGDHESRSVSEGEQRGTG